MTAGGLRSLAVPRRDGEGAPRGTRGAPEGRLPVTSPRGQGARRDIWPHGVTGGGGRRRPHGRRERISRKPFRRSRFGSALSPIPRSPRRIVVASASKVTAGKISHRP